MDDFQQIQRQFTQAVRNRTGNPFHDLNSKRFDVYPKLIRNTIYSFISQGFPVIKKALNETDFDELVDDFIKEHKAQSPYFIDISVEFLTWLNLRHSSEEHNKQPSFLYELAHYEWLETALLGNEQDEPMANRITDFLACDSPLLWSVNAVASAYQFPVHKISVDFQPSSAPETPTLLIVYRKNDESHFVEVDALAFQLFQSAVSSDQSLNSQSLIRHVLNDLPSDEQTKLKQPAQNALFQLHRLGLILGAS